METKKFLDLTGLRKYDELIKDVIAKGDAAERTYLDTNFKVKDVDNSTTVLITNTNGVIKAEVTGHVVVDEQYATVKTNANNSAAAWGKFLDGSSSEYPNGITPKLSDLATKTTVEGLQNTLSNDYVTKADYNANNEAVTNTIINAQTAATGAANAYTDGKIGEVNSTIETKVLELNTTIERAQTNATGAANSYTNEQIAEVNGTINTKVGELTTTIGTKAVEEEGKEATGLYAEIAAAEQSAKNYADTVKNDLIGSDTSGVDTIKGLKEYVDDQDGALISRIQGIETGIAGGVHFIGISSTDITDLGTEIPDIDGWSGPVKTGDIVIDKDGEEFIWNGSAWQKLGDTTAELQRIDALEGNVGTLMGDKNTAGSVAKALEDAKAYTNIEIDTLKGDTGQVGINTAAIAINTAAIATLNGDENTPGSVAKTVKDYADQKDGEVKTTLIGNDTDAPTLDTIWAAKNYAQNAANEVYNSIQAIDEDDIIALFPTSAN